MSEKEKKDAVNEEQPNPENSPQPEPEKEEPPKSYKRISFVLSIILIFAGIVTMFNTWEVLRIKIYRQGNQIINAEFNRNQAELISQTTAQQNLTTYSYYRINQLLQDDLLDAYYEQLDLQDAGSDDFDEARLFQIEDAYNDASQLTNVQAFYFPTQYIDTDGRYNFERNRAEVYADIASGLETDSDKLLEEANDLRERRIIFMEATRLLGLSIAILGFEKIFYWKRRIVRYPIILAGLTMLTLGFVTYISNNPDPLSFFV